MSFFFTFLWVDLANHFFLRAWLSGEKQNKRGGKFHLWNLLWVSLIIQLREALIIHRHELDRIPVKTEYRAVAVTLPATHPYFHKYKKPTRKSFCLDNPTQLPVRSLPACLLPRPLIIAVFVTTRVILYLIIKLGDTFMFEVSLPRVLINLYSQRKKLGLLGWTWVAKLTDMRVWIFHSKFEIVTIWLVDSVIFKFSVKLSKLTQI